VLFNVIASRIVHHVQDRELHRTAHIEQGREVREEHQSERISGETFVVVAINRK